MSGEADSEAACGLRLENVLEIEVVCGERVIRVEQLRRHVTQLGGVLSLAAPRLDSAWYAHHYKIQCDGNVEQDVYRLGSHGLC